MNENIYFLNEEVIFTPSKRLLSRCDGRVTPVLLNSPSVKILRVLLSNDGITTQNTLYKSAWENNGLEITPNNLYQNISLLRRGLNSVFLKDVNYIITVPRKGFYISTDVNIRISMAIIELSRPRDIVQFASPAEEAIGISVFTRAANVNTSKKVTRKRRGNKKITSVIFSGVLFLFACYTGVLLTSILGL